MTDDLIKIEYKDKANWVTTLADKEVNWTNYSSKYKNEQIQPYYVAPTIITDSWNGKEYDIQHLTHTSYYFELFLKSSEIHFLEQLKSCSDIRITHYSLPSGGLIVNNVYTLDLTKSDFIEIAEPERVGNTSGWKTSITFRTERTVIDKALPVNRTNRVTFNTTKEWSLNFISSIPGKIVLLDEFNLASLNFSILQKYKRVGDAWITDGASLFIFGLGSEPAIAGLDSTSVAVVEFGQGFLSKFVFSNGIWSQVGNALNLPGTYSNPSMAGLSGSRVVVYDDSVSEIATYDFDGTNWAAFGVSLPLILVGSTSIAAMTSTKIAFVEPSGQMTEYNLVAGAWISGQTISLGQFGVVTRLEDDRVATFNLTTDSLISYKLNGSWVQEAGSVSVPSTSDASIVGLNANEVYLRANISGNYDFGAKTYYTDFDILDWAKLTEDVRSNWRGDIDTVIQSISKTGYELVLYLKTPGYDKFTSEFKNALNADINSVSVNELMYEPALIGEDLYKIIIRGVETKTVINKGGSVNNTHGLIINGNTYYTDFPINVNEKQIDSINVNWPDGTIKNAQSTYKKTWSLLFYLTDGQLENFQEDFRVSQIKTINGLPTQEAELVTELVGENYNSVVVTGAVTTTVTNHDMSPLNTYNLVVNGNTYYTDYAIEFISEPAEIKTYSNQTGINGSSKAIAKKVRQITLFLDEADKVALENDFVLAGQNAVINPGAIPVLETRQPVSTTLGFDLYEVKVNCLTDVTIN